MSRPEEEERATQDINVKECESLTATSFFQSLQLQTVHSIQEAPREDNYKDTQKEKLDDLSFFESIGLYWVNAADRTNVSNGSENQESVGSNVTTTDGKKEKSIDTGLDEFDFLNVLGLTPVTGGSSQNKRWRLWNPEVDAHSWDDDINYICQDIDIHDQDGHHDTPATDPTIMEHQHFPIANSSKNQDLLGTHVLVDSNPENAETVSSTKSDDCDHITNTELNVTERPKRKIIKRKMFEELQNGSKKQKTVETVSRCEEGRLLECGSCGATVSRHQYGKHLVSHYHYHRSLGHPDNTNIILHNIRDIVTQSPFQCQACQFYCNWHSDLTTHFQLEKHSQGGKFWCQVCMKIIEDQKMLVSHLNSFNHTELVSVINRSVPVIIKQISLVACNICQKEFRFNLGLKKHMQIIHGEKDFELENQKKFYCDSCDYFSYKSSSVKTHRFLVHPNPRLKYDCHTCKQQFLSKETVTAHRNSKTHKANVQLKKDITDQVSCSFCSQWFMDSEDLKKHLESQHFTDLPQCHLCGQIFLFPQQLTVHLKLDCQTKSEVSPAMKQTQHHCAYCSFSALREEILTLHESYRHSHSDETAISASKCPVCFEPINTNKSAKHIINHDGQKSCDSCGQLSRFKKHQTACNEIGKFCCPVCSYQGSSKILLNLHFKRQHQQRKNDKVFRCSECDSEFKSNSSLKNHYKNAHLEATQAPKFLCNFENCGFRCSYKSDLERHQLKHSDSKDLHCNDCDFTCKRRNELMRHHRLVHQDTPYSECSFCDYKTKNVQHLKRHISSMHKLNQVSYFEIHLDENDFMVGKTDLC